MNSSYLTRDNNICSYPYFDIKFDSVILNFFALLKLLQRMMINYKRENERDARGASEEEEEALEYGNVI